MKPSEVVGGQNVKITVISQFEGQEPETSEGIQGLIALGMTGDDSEVQILGEMSGPDILAHFTGIGVGVMRLLADDYDVPLTKVIVLMQHAFDLIIRDGSEKVVMDMADNDPMTALMEIAKMLGGEAK